MFGLVAGFGRGVRRGDGGLGSDEVADKGSDKGGDKGGDKVGDEGWDGATEY